MAFKLQRLKGSIQIADATGKPTLTFVQYWQQFAEQIERVIAAIATILGITDELNEALARAEAAAEAAKEAADEAQQQTDAAKREAALQSSYIDPSSVLTASSTSITIAPHTRFYSDGTSADVSGATIPALAEGSTAYVSYEDADRTGGAVSYVVSGNAPTQTGATHVVGAVVIPTAGQPEQPGGDGPQRPGYVRPREPLTVEP